MLKMCPKRLPACSQDELGDASHAGPLTHENSWAFWGSGQVGDNNSKALYCSCSSCLFEQPVGVSCFQGSLPFFQGNQPEKHQLLKLDTAILSTSPSEDALGTPGVPLVSPRSGGWLGRCEAALLRALALVLGRSPHVPPTPRPWLPLISL